MVRYNKDKILKELLEKATQLYTNQDITYEEYMSCKVIVDGVETLNEDYLNIDGDMRFNNNFQKHLKDGHIYEKSFHNKMTRLVEVKGHKIQYQETGNLWLETESLLSGQWVPSRTGLLGMDEDTLLVFMLHREDITNENVSEWMVATTKKEWKDEIRRQGLDISITNDGKTKGFKVPIKNLPIPNTMVHNYLDTHEIKLRQSNYLKKRLQMISNNKHN